MKLVTPTVRLVTRPEIDWNEVIAYLCDDVGGSSDWAFDRKTDVPDGEALIEFFARLCYRSFEPGLNPNVTRVRKDRAEYFENILASQHGSVLAHAHYGFVFHNVSRVFCYDEQTEVLTSEGWKQFPDVTGAELFGTLNPHTNQLEYQAATERFARDYVGQMYRISSQQVDLLVTPNHRMWVQLHDTQMAKRGEEPFQVQYAKDLLGKRVSYQKTASWTAPHPESVIVRPTTRTYHRRDRFKPATRTYNGWSFPVVQFARFLASFLSEGSLNGHQICIAQNRGAKLDAIAENIRAMGLPAYIPTTGHGCVKTQHIALRDWLSSECGSGASMKRVPDIVGTWPSPLIREFMEAYIDGDGSRRTDCNHAVIYTVSRHMADSLQVLAIKAGWTANVRVDNRVGNVRIMASGQSFVNQHECFIVSIVTRKTTPLVNHGTHGRKHDAMVQYSGRVYCVKVPNGLLFVRRNGKPVVSGNTHEIVRHAAGTDISQESLRFVRLDDFRFWMPEWAQDDIDLTARIAAHVQAAEDLQRWMADRFSLDGSAFSHKKHKTSFMRRFAPIGLATTIGMTFNVRAIRHVLEMRWSEHAEEEMLIVMPQVYSIMQRECPLLFNDYTITPSGIATPHRKV